MARTVRLDALRGLARLYADQRTASESTAFVNSTELNSLINLALSELYDELVKAAGEQFYATNTTLSVVAGTSTYSLPALFYQLCDVHLEWATDDLEPVTPLMAATERYKFAGAQWSPWELKAYRLTGDSLVFIPTPTSAVTANVRYVPAITDLVNDSDTFNGVNGWEKLVALRAAGELLAIYSKPNGHVLQLYERELERVRGLANDRDSEQNHEVRDTYPEGGLIPGRWPYHGRKVYVL